MHPLGQHLPLGWKNLSLHDLHFLTVAGPRTRHAAVVDSPHPRGIDVLVRGIGLDAFFPVFGYFCAVGAPVPIPPAAAVRRSPAIPFPDIVAKHLLAMGRPHHNSVLLGNDLVVFKGIERLGAVMHSRPQMVGFQTQQQFKHFSIGLRPDIPVFGRIGLSRPRMQPPIFIIDEDPAIFHRRRTLFITAGPHHQPLPMKNGHIRPPEPGRNPHSFRQIEHPVGRPAPVAAGNDQTSLH